MPTPKTRHIRNNYLFVKKCVFLLSDRNRQFCVFWYSEKKWVKSVKIANLYI